MRITESDFLKINLYRSWRMVERMMRRSTGQRRFSMWSGIFLLHRANFKAILIMRFPMTELSDG